MKVRMRATLSGAGDGKRWPPAGETAEVPDAAGARLCSAGLAEPVAEKSADKAEKSVSPASEERHGGKDSGKDSVKRRADADGR